MKMSDMMYGVKMYFSALLRGGIISPGSMPTGLVERIYIKKIEEDIRKTNDACVSVTDLMETSYPVPIKEFFKETGKRYAMTNNNTECARFLTDYLTWLDSKSEKPIDVEEIMEDAKEKASSLMPNMSFNFGIGDALKGFGDGLKGLKGSLQVTAVVGIVVVLLIVYMATGKGKKGVAVR